MLLKLNTGITAKGFSAMPGDVVDWQCDADCGRMIDRGLATKATAEEIKAAAGKVRSYTPGKRRPDEVWPPGHLKKLKSGDEAS